MTEEERALAACGPVATEIFFDDIDDHKRTTPEYAEALAIAREFCDGCPVRTVCLVGQVNVPEGTAAGYSGPARKFLRMGALRWSPRRDS